MEGGFETTVHVDLDEIHEPETRSETEGTSLEAVRV